MHTGSVNKWKYSAHCKGAVFISQPEAAERKCVAYVVTIVCVHLFLCCREACLASGASGPGFSFIPPPSFQLKRLGSVLDYWLANV